MIVLRPRASQLYIFGFVICWIFAPSTKAEKLKCWSNIEKKENRKKPEAPENQKAEDLEPEKALSLMATPVEEECNRGYICAELEITLKIKSKESYFDLKGCMWNNDHAGVCNAIKKAVGSGVDEMSDDDVDCELEASYCITNFCNQSTLGKTIGIVVGVILGVILLAVITYFVYAKVLNKSNANANNYNNNSNVNKGRRHEKRRSSKSRSKSREYRRVPLPPATTMMTTTTMGDGIGDQSLEEVTVNEQHQADN